MGCVPAFRPGVNNSPSEKHPRRLKKTLVSKFASKFLLPGGPRAATKEAILELTLLGTGRRTSIHDATEQRPLLHPESVFDHLTNLTPELVQNSLTGMNNDILEVAKECGLLPATATVAWDIHVDPDYTATHNGCIGYKDLPGTSYGMAYLSAEIVCKDPRFTLAFTPIRPFTNREEALEAQVDAVLRWVDLELALLDRGFQAAYVFKLFTRRNKRFVVPMIHNSRLDALEEEAWRQRQAIPNTPYAYHVVQNYDIGPTGGEKAVVNLVFFFEPDPKEPEKDKCFIFATNVGEITAALAMKWAEHYRLRWGIETGYRVKDKVRIRTTSDHYGARLYLQLFCIIAYNLWTLLRSLRAKREWFDDRPMKQGYLLRQFCDDLVVIESA